MPKPALRPCFLIKQLYNEKIMKPEQPEILHEGSEEIEEFERSLPNDVKELIEMRNALTIQRKVDYKEIDGSEAFRFVIKKIRAINHKLKELGAE